MGRMTNEDLASMKMVLRKLMNKHRYAGVHVEITQLRRWGLTPSALKYMVNNHILLGKKSQGNDEYSVNTHKLKMIHWILQQVRDASELP